MRRRSQTGQALVEFALIAPALVALVLGVFQFGYPLYVYTALQDAVGRGARYASSATYASSTFAPVESGFAAAVRNVVVYGRPEGGGPPVAHGLGSGNVFVDVISENGAPTQVRVSVSGYTMPLPFGPLTFTNKPAVAMRYVGRFAPA